MRGPVMWLEGLVEGGGAEVEREVGWRAIAFARLLAAGVEVPPGFVLPGAHYAAFAAGPPGEPLPRDAIDAIYAGWSTLAGPAVVRALPLRERSGAKQRRRGGRPEREMYLHLVDVAEVVEAVRRLWSRMSATRPPTPAAALVQKFVVAESSAVLHPARAGADLLHIESAFGGGDLLAAGLVLPDRLVVELPSARVTSRRLGRKQHLSAPRPEGGVDRRTSPPGASRQASLSDPAAARVVALWQKVEGVLGKLASLSVAIEGDHLWVTSVAVAD